MNTRIALASILSVLVLLGTFDAAAGPATGTYTGGMLRACPAAKPKVKVYRTTARASDGLPNNPTSATRVRCTGSAGSTDNVSIDVSIRRTGKVNVTIKGTLKSRTTGQPIRFNATGSARGRNLDSSVVIVRIPNGRLGATTATIDVTAASGTGPNGKTQLNLEVAIYPKAVHPLGVFTAAFVGTN